VNRLFANSQPSFLMKVFISHIAEENDLAVLLKEQIADDFLGKVECFVSSDTASILAGDNWLKSVEDALKTASVEVILCSPASVKRAWINFEAGAGWMRDIPIVPICHSGLTPRSLPMPLTVLQAISASEPTGLQKLYETIADRHKSRVPRPRFDSLITKIVEFERAYQVRMPRSFSEQTERDRLVLQRMMEALNDPRWPRSRNVERLSSIGGVSVSEAVDLLRTQQEVEFAKSKQGNLIARLRSRSR
jgi:TIR domain-containing protein